MGVLAVAALLMANAFFVAAEFSLVAVDRAVVEAATNAGSAPDRRVLRLLTRLTTHLSGAQFGITSSALLLGFVAEPTVARLLTGEDRSTGLSVALAVTVAAALHLVLGEQVPKYLALASPDRTARRLAPMVAAYGVLTRPLVVALNGAANAVVRRLGVAPREELGVSHTLEQFEAVVRSSSSGGDIDPAEATLLRRSIRFGDKTAADALVPRVEVEALQRDDLAPALIERCVATGFSRFPVFTDDLDNIVGVVHVKSVYSVPATERSGVCVGDLMHEALAVPETRGLDLILDDMRRARKQMAVVVDEHGGTAGVVSMEDLLEEIVGEIDDEHDPRVDRTSVEDSGSTVLSGGLHLDEVEEASGFRVPEGPYETFAGFVLARLGHIPEPSEMVHEDGWRVEVVAVKGRRIETLRVVAPGTGSVIASDEAEGEAP
ncbi:MAG: HlyC/CorC family transporter [Candidatus Marinimicrobia bacterium]|jgi:CBS domain containing-hemolysin-like protein|nr:HlyC/CorC family transporter [Candidatus Neomarinimicrobiota bacterium]